MREWVRQSLRWVTWNWLTARQDKLIELTGYDFVTGQITGGDKIQDARYAADARDYVPAAELRAEHRALMDRIKDRLKEINPLFPELLEILNYATYLKGKRKKETRVADLHKTRGYEVVWKEVAAHMESRTRIKWNYQKAVALGNEMAPHLKEISEDEMDAARHEFIGGLLYIDGRKVEPMEHPTWDRLKPRPKVTKVSKVIECPFCFEETPAPKKLKGKDRGILCENCGMGLPLDTIKSQEKMQTIKTGRRAPKNYDPFENAPMSRQVPRPGDKPSIYHQLPVNNKPVPKDITEECGKTTERTWEEAE